MLIVNTLIDWYQISYSLAGFDRPRFVSDITETIPQDESCQIARLSFIGDGIQARGQLTIRVRQPQGFSLIQDRLRAVKGMVSVQTD
ncbi:MAG: hypothetical protein JWP57_1311 [Spirosoma sp.]|nr:hypothetical protein [Spirosoma sp.]